MGSGLTDKIRRNPPKVGSIIVYRFQELTRDGVPRYVYFFMRKFNLTPRLPSGSRRTSVKRSTRINLKMQKFPLIVEPVTMDDLISKIIIAFWKSDFACIVLSSSSSSFASFSLNSKLDYPFYLYYASIHFFAG